MHARIATVAFQGIDVVEVDVQIHLATGFSGLALVGLPDKAVGESRERIRSALAAIGLALPARRVTINLSPADLNKEGSHYDLPIALALLTAIGVFAPDQLQAFVSLGELALDSSLKRVTGVLPAAVAAARSQRGLICPAACGSEAAWSGAGDIVAAPSLLSVVNHFKGVQVLSPPTPRVVSAPATQHDFQDVKGQETAKRALEVAAAGGHHLLMVGPPGSGKSMLAQRLSGILPPLEPAEVLESSMIHSVAGLLEGGAIVSRRPFRDPHHSATMAAMVGGGVRARPGEISLAHNGVLFLDELPEFPRGVLEALRQPLETGRAVVSRANATASFPARVMLVCAANVCRCGRAGAGDPAGECGRMPRCSKDYLARLSGPLLDRIDLRIEVGAVPARTLSGPSRSEASSVVADRVLAARRRAIERLRKLELPVPRSGANAELDGKALEKTAVLESDAAKLLADFTAKRRLSARGHTRVVRVARTIADLAGAATIARNHIAEALSYRGSALFG
ncbi:MAG: YifB family Mg chelatase-like AAA ATPase [Alphaproteobacteria bacterium]|nr:YifB family Mg chelatase-like AAA ATPase [Alphaproteobacteria bacterium]